PERRAGVIIVGFALCKAIGCICIAVSFGDRVGEVAVVLIASDFELVFYAVLSSLYFAALLSWLVMEMTTGDYSFGGSVVSVLVFLGIPLLAGFLTRTFGEKAKGRDWYEHTFLPKIGPWSLYGLLFTIVLLFAMQGDAITSQPLDVARIAVPLL